MTKKEIINSFLNGTRNAQGRNALSVRNGALYSYNLKIAEHVTNYNGGNFTGVLIYNYQADGIGFYSMTTSQHVGLIKRAVRGANIITNVAPV
tara:strand:+ start:1321 stop:1599 length:279 start_codon:yes stop_codon:yes gene_type:complete